MRECVKNKQAMFYSLPTDETVPIYQLDDEGNIIYEETGGELIALTNGEHVKYAEPVGFSNGISGDLNSFDLQAFGVDDSNGYAKMVYKNGALPLVKGAIIWKKSEIRYNGENVDETSADYMVKAIRDEDLNEWSALLQRIVR